MVKDQYKSFQGVIKLWCLIKWKDCELTCAERMAVETADVIAAVGDRHIGFVFTLDKTADFLKAQIINCRKSCDKVYLITNEIDLGNIPEVENKLDILNIADRYGLGNIVEEV